MARAKSRGLDEGLEELYSRVGIARERARALKAGRGWRGETTQETAACLHDDLLVADSLAWELHQPESFRAGVSEALELASGPGLVGDRVRAGHIVELLAPAEFGALLPGIDLPGERWAILLLSRLLPRAQISQVLGDIVEELRLLQGRRLTRIQLGVSLWLQVLAEVRITARLVRRWRVWVGGGALWAAKSAGWSGTVMHAVFPGKLPWGHG